jgi:hypothetical protein
MRRMASRMESTEMRQQQMMAFLARAVNNPAFLQQLLSARQNQRTLDSKGAKVDCAPCKLLHSCSNEEVLAAARSPWQAVACAELGS